MQKKIKNALISLSDKSDLLPLLKSLKKNNVKIISSGGTYKSIKKLGFNCLEVSSYTGFKEMLDGRVKTLHPKIHAGILYDRSKGTHKKQIAKLSFLSIDLVIVNFYPFQRVIKESNNVKKVIENIDIGGPTMVRAAAKNYKDVLIITSNNDYSSLIQEMKKYKGKTSLKFREHMSSKAFGVTAYYDAVIANWFNKRLKINFPERKIIYGKKLKQLRYGENPHQRSSIYSSDYDNNIVGLKQLGGKELSYNNYNDIFSSLKILLSIKKNPTTVIIKHANPCGVSVNKSALTSFKNAFSCDPLSAFGGVIACNFKIDKALANEIDKNFLEVILAKGFEKNALQILNKKKNLRIIDISKYKQSDMTSIKPHDGSFLLQDVDEPIFQYKELQCVTKKKPSKEELKKIEFTFNICKFVKSNAIILTHGFSTIGIGAGQSSRIDSCRIAVQKAKKFQPKLIKNSIAASDAFFPFADGIKTLINAGVKIIVQPGGSIRDKEVIAAADKANVKMIFTKMRHFNH